jgi:hypothetical protein
LQVARVAKRKMLSWFKILPLFYLGKEKISSVLTSIKWNESLLLGIEPFLFSQFP